MVHMIMTRTYLEKPGFIIAYDLIGRYQLNSLYEWVMARHGMEIPTFKSRCRQSASQVPIRNRIADELKKNVTEIDTQTRTMNST